MNMKRTFKFIASAVAVVALFSFSVKAQTNEPAGDSHLWRLGIGFSAGVPTKDAYKIALGGDLRLQKDFFSNISGTLSAGYTSFSIKDKFGGGDIGYIPVKVGVKIFPVERFYISGEVGAGFGTDTGQGTALVYAPGIGVGFNHGIDLGLRYEGFAQNGSNLDQIALRLAYGFRLGR